MANQERPRRSQPPGHAVEEPSKQALDDEDWADDEGYQPALGREPPAASDSLEQWKVPSERHHAENAARREIGNHARLELLREYLDALIAVRDLCGKIYGPIEERQADPMRRVQHSSPDDAPVPRGINRSGTRTTAAARDDDLVADGISRDGEPLRAALAQEIDVVSESLRLADSYDLTPSSPDDLRATTAAIMMERGANAYRATAAVYKLEPDNIASSAERKRAVRAAARRKARREARGAVAGRELANDEAVDRAVAEVDSVTLLRRKPKPLQAKASETGGEPGDLAGRTK